MSGQNLTQGSIPKQLWSLAWPMMLSMFFNSLYNLVDAIWVAKISASAIAAVSISQIVLFAMVSLAMGVSVGTAVLVGHSIGASKKLEAERLLGQGYLLTIIAAIGFSSLVFLFRERLLGLSGAVGEIFPLALPYFNVVTLGSILMFLMMTTSISFNAQGDNFTTTKLFALSTFVNVVLDPLLIFGYFGFPALGITGAAYATLISQLVFVVLSIRILMKPSMMVPLKFENLNLKLDSVKKVVDIGLPASLNQVLNPIGFSVLMSIVSGTFFEAGAAAFSIGFRIEFFAFIPAIGFGFGAMSLIGQNMGAKKMDRVKESLKRAIIYGSGSAVVFSLISFLFAPQIVAIFTKDPTVSAYSLSYFYIVPIGYAFFAMAFIEANVFQGIGRSWPGFWITFTRIGLAVAFSSIAIKVFKLGIWAVWTSIVAGSVLASLFGLFWVVKALDQAKPEESPDEYTLEAEEVIPQI
ncbi:MAG: MATE family efflux transporter [Bdellovibrionota bacterium]|nr:MATE family efflux transporter [Bdellovibrionota bacterium]